MKTNLGTRSRTSINNMVKISRKKHGRIISSLFSTFCLLIPSLLALPTSAERAARGVITRRVSGCDHFVVATKSDYDLLEWYGGHDPDKGNVLIGNYESYGFHDIYDDTADRTLRVWTEDYSLSKEDALEKLLEHCE